MPFLADGRVLTNSLASTTSRDTFVSMACADHNPKSARITSLLTHIQMRRLPKGDMYPNLTDWGVRDGRIAVAAVAATVAAHYQATGYQNTWR